jgi:hypothetical protein
MSAALENLDGGGGGGDNVDISKTLEIIRGRDYKNFSHRESQLL